MIELKEVSVSISERCVLHDISLTVKKGETLAIVGASGGGKTTLARLLLGLLSEPPLDDSCHRGFEITGHIRVGDINPLSASAAQLHAYRRRSVGLVVQALSDALNPQLTVLQHIQEVARIDHGTQLDASDICLRYNIPERLYNRYPTGLSGGEIQRILTALAMANSPPYLILDEPTASLDETNKQRAISVINEGRENRHQLLFTHDLDLAKLTADHIGVLCGGRLVEVGVIEDVFDNPQHSYTQRLLACNHPVKSQARNNKRRYAKNLNKEQGLLVSGVTHTIENKRILHDVSFFVPPGECLAMLGASGSGKSTLARLLTGFQPLQSGVIEWREDTQPPSDLPRGSKHPPEPLRRDNAKSLTLISQFPYRAMARHFTVQEVLEEALRFTYSKYANTHYLNNSITVDSLLDRVGLPKTAGFKHQKVAFLSGGEAQRLTIARALAMRCRCIVADEPTAALDMHAREQILQLLNDIQKTQNIALVLFTHDQDAANRLADQTIYLKNGKTDPFQDFIEASHAIDKQRSVTTYNCKRQEYINR